MIGNITFFLPFMEAFALYTGHCRTTCKDVDTTYCISKYLISIYFKATARLDAEDDVRLAQAAEEDRERHAGQRYVDMIRQEADAMTARGYVPRVRGSEFNKYNLQDRHNYTKESTDLRCALTKTFDLPR